MSKRVNELEQFYKRMNEDDRLQSNSGRIEFLTTISYIEKYLKKGDRILDIGAGTGIYSLYFADKGYEVVSIDLLKHHVDKIKEKVTKDMNIEIFQADAIDLSDIKDEHFDIILCFGPLYHLEDLNDQIKCLEEVKRLSNKNTKIFLSFVSNDMVIVTETILYNKDFLLSDLYNHNTFRLKNMPINFHLIEECRDLISSLKLNILSEIASDGLSELLSESINSMDDETYDRWLKYHLYTSDKKEFLGNSNHWLFIVENKI